MSGCGNCGECSGCSRTVITKQGERGPVGATGVPGPQGPAGTNGTNGTNGVSPVVTGTSTTNLAVGLGSKIFTTQSGISWVLGQRLRAASDDGTILMEGEITAYTGTSLTIDVDYREGVGSHADWNIGIAGAVGPEGPAGGAGDADVASVIAESHTGGFTVSAVAKTMYLSRNDHPSNPTVFDLPLTATLGNPVVVTSLEGFAKITVAAPSEVLYNNAPTNAPLNTDFSSFQSPVGFLIGPGETAEARYMGASIAGTQTWVITKVETFSTGYYQNDPVDRLV